MTAEEASLWGAILGAVLGGLSGGGVAFFSERSHDVRRRRQALLDQFTDLSIEFAGDVHAYWASQGPDQALQARILSGINKIRAKVVQLGLDVTADVEVRRLLKELFQFATGGTFATKAHVPDLQRPLQVQERLEKIDSALRSRIR